jgi:hypothetical protein
MFLAIGPAGRLALKPAMPGLPIAGIHHLPIAKNTESERMRKSKLKKR